MYATRLPRRTRPSRARRLPAGPADPLRAARDRVGLALLAADSLGRHALARLRRSPLVRWRHRAPIAHELLLAPPDLRPADPSFVDELGSGSVGLAGLTAELRGASPFAVPPPSPAWERELHGFGWLRHFSAVRTVDNEALARRLVAEWLAVPQRAVPLAWTADVVGRRMLSWLSHAGVLLEGATRREHAALLRSLEDQAGHLSAAWRDAPDGYPRLLALIALVQSSLCIGGHERRLDAAEKQLIAELDRQILDDGGHISRNPGTLVALLLDLLPLPQCFGARGLTSDERLARAIDRMMAMVARLRLGDGQLAHFNGMGATERDALAMVLAYQRGLAAGGAKAVGGSGYVRLQRGSTAVVVDAGPPPPIALAGQACAGCLSFEMSTGEELLLVNGGAPAAADARMVAASRGTASHNTLVLGGQSSSRLIRHAGLRRRLGAAPIHRPDRVTCAAEEREDGAILLRMSHDGYADRFGLVHVRSLMLSADGTCLDGEDVLHGLKGEVRLAHDIPVAVHFHLPPQAGARYGTVESTADLVLSSGARWRLSVSGAALTIEPSTHFAELRGPVRTQQVVLRTACYGAARVRWRLERA